MHERGGNGNLPLLFALVIIGDGGAGGNAAHAIDHARAREHRFAEHGFPGRSVTDDGEVTDISGLIFFHNEKVLRLVRVEWLARTVGIYSRAGHSPSEYMSSATNGQRRARNDRNRRNQLAVYLCVLCWLLFKLTAPEGGLPCPPITIRFA
jgi:hypothetical protein